MNVDVTAYISSKDRYFTTLPSTVLSIINQTVKPQALMLFLDGEHTDLRLSDVYMGLFKLMDFYNIKWQVVWGEQKGQVLNHHKAIYLSNTKWIWRVDDDTFPEPTALQELLACDEDTVGAIGGLVIDPKNIDTLPLQASSNINDIYKGINIQWFLHPTERVVEVDHLYSTFLYKKKAASHGYCLELSPVGHREETIFSHEMKRMGWKLLVTPKSKTWHVRQSAGGIRTQNNHPEYWAHDEAIFSRKMAEWNGHKFIVLDNGLGDHFAFKMALPKIKEKFKDKKIVLAVCYPEVFIDDPSVSMISIEEAWRLGFKKPDCCIYEWMQFRNWKESLVKAFETKYLES